MRRFYKFNQLPEGYCKLAIAVWKALSDYELFEIEGKLVLTDDVASYLEEDTEVGFMAEEFDSHDALELWLLNTIRQWIEEDPMLVNDLDEYIRVI